MTKKDLRDHGLSALFGLISGGSMAAALHIATANAGVVGETLVIVGGTVVGGSVVGGSVLANAFKTLGVKDRCASFMIAGCVGVFAVYGMISEKDQKLAFQECDDSKNAAQLMDGKEVLKTNRSPLPKNCSLKFE
ncbi:MAG: hypothetical protein COB76_04425 [Alphaproteobacteria bacterium]|nr:MAG: hypothetical protein COB76_04425 [Alphaproteobacteria bacterium]